MRHSHVLTLGFAHIGQEITRHGAFEQVIPVHHVQRLLATLRNAEFGFFGVVVYTLVQTPLFCGLFSNAGTLLLTRLAVRGFRTN